MKYYQYDVKMSSTFTFHNICKMNIFTSCHKIYIIVYIYSTIYLDYYGTNSSMYSRSLHSKDVHRIFPLSRCNVQPVTIPNILNLSVWIGNTF